LLFGSVIAPEPRRFTIAVNDLRRLGDTSFALAPLNGVAFRPPVPKLA
jgi:hypothetical protein